jgi:BirA family transcriptional regulator, biotin operon repressor / biotin---[acetyl-CoA-carboxylase] ligase
MTSEPRATAAGLPLIVYDVLGSTNAEALRLVREGERGPLWIAARWQTAGRGRRGRRWISPPGNLYASLLLTKPGSMGILPQLSFVAALAIHDAIAEVAGYLAERLAIKWPNDVLLEAAKVAGILIEGDGEGAVAVGIGINCASHPADTDYPATDLAATGVTPENLLGVLAVTMQTRLTQWNGGNGFSAIRTDWLDRAAGLGEEVRVRLADREIIGRFEALDAAGGLLLRLPGGDVTTIAAGDVFLLATAASATAG